ncbi:uncharacterized protein LOC127843073 [Dreissena polymorpha]|uniref:Uncharacterized protein n=1 Tax=Dreissena polymorpha TaxID=45954 RepID=A0A9D4ISE5_DREPO|nr:uncharacterized protein LOC127843073 [Dreissena polymorpha]KAH3784925.1 hypothetical protein DPMN_162997 [Dreissena polymorpha]
MMCSATSFLLLVTFCGTVSCLWYPWPAKKDDHCPCKKDSDCKYVVCDNPWEEVECHDDYSSPTGRSCHCHKPYECWVDYDCIRECGPGATCDDRACHGPWCDHT